MAWEGANAGRGVGELGMGTAERFLCVKVMTDEQMEVLRKQISVYAAICEQLVEMHRAITARQDSIAEMRLGSVFGDPMAMTGGQKTMARQRWSPTPPQLHILERMFVQTTGTPSKKKIREITSALAKHGQISETNVYNWFQNRRARAKRKPSGEASSMEPENAMDSAMEKKCKLGSASICDPSNKPSA